VLGAIAIPCSDSTTPSATRQLWWLASGAEAAGRAWKQACEPWLDERGIHVGQRLDLLSIGLNLMVCADLLRPTVRCLAASSVSSWALARNLEASRDPGEFGRLRAPRARPTGT
jgi:hypothetical protein